jgi:hypothetical protein
MRYTALTDLFVFIWYPPTVVVYGSSSAVWIMFHFAATLCYLAVKWFHLVLNSQYGPLFSGAYLFVYGMFIWFVACRITYLNVRIRVNRFYANPRDMRAYHVVLAELYTYFSLRNLFWTLIGAATVIHCPVVSVSCVFSASGGFGFIWDLLFGRYEHDANPPAEPTNDTLANRRREANAPVAARQQQQQAGPPGAPGAPRPIAFVPGGVQVPGAAAPARRPPGVGAVPADQRAEANLLGGDRANGQGIENFVHGVRGNLLRNAGFTDAAVGEVVHNAVNNGPVQGVPELAGAPAELDEAPRIEPVPEVAALVEFAGLLLEAKGKTKQKGAYQLRFDGKHWNMARKKQKQHHVSPTGEEDYDRDHHDDMSGMRDAGPDRPDTPPIDLPDELRGRNVTMLKDGFYEDENGDIRQLARYNKQQNPIGFQDFIDDHERWSKDLSDDEESRKFIETAKIICTEMRERYLESIAGTVALTTPPATATLVKRPQPAPQPTPPPQREAPSKPAPKPKNKAPVPEPKVEPPKSVQPKGKAPAAEPKVEAVSKSAVTSGGLVVNRVFKEENPFKRKEAVRPDNPPFPTFETGFVEGPDDQKLCSFLRVGNGIVTVRHVLGDAEKFSGMSFNKDKTRCVKLAPDLSFLFVSPPTVSCVPVNKFAVASDALLGKKVAICGPLNKHLSTGVITRITYEGSDVYIEYNLSTEIGDCGCPVVLEDGRIVAIHRADGQGVGFTDEMLKFFRDPRLVSASAPGAKSSESSRTADPARKIGGRKRSRRPKGGRAARSATASN